MLAEADSEAGGKKVEPGCLQAGTARPLRKLDLILDILKFSIESCFTI
jgi:hypothetical protein